MRPTVGPVDLWSMPRLDLAGYGVAPLHSVGLTRLDASDQVELVADACEIFCYLVAGTAAATVGGRQHPLTAGSGATLVQGERAVITAASPIRLFWVRSLVEGEAP
jgi:glyoxylate utilization-related uncharacterized protein